MKTTFQNSIVKKHTMIHNPSNRTLTIWPYNLLVESDSESGREQFTVPEHLISDIKLSLLPDKVGIVPSVYYDKNGRGLLYNVPLVISKESNSKARVQFLKQLEDETTNVAKIEKTQSRKLKNRLILKRKQFQPKIGQSAKASSQSDNSVQYSIVASGKTVGDVVHAAIKFDQSINQEFNKLLPDMGCKIEE